MTAEKMMEYLYGLPNQFVECLKAEFTFMGNYKKRYKNIVVSGLGGSAIGGDILRSYAENKGNIPVIVNRSYEIPNFVDEKTLFFAVSYSGNTEETLSAYEKAKNKRADIICITSGGKLSLMAESDGYGVVKVPSGLVPRAAIGYLFCPMALILSELGIFPNLKSEIEETVQVLSELREEIKPDIVFPDNPARRLAESLMDSIPVIWGSIGGTETAALRFKAQINENAKSPAYYNVFPELNHNEVVGFAVPEDILSRVVIVIFEDKYDNPRIKKRIDITEDIVKNRVKNLLRIESRGESFLARLFSLIYLGDYASVYLAGRYSINPTPVGVIDYLKARLSEG
ncbi:MAG: bifunctional phosphoglucose/phosphomannose isomerase [Thermosyntropha sp.]|nr:bifunctional phosphoglucose/phosphomannose isomerase [Thermosyntropha sp.]